jgi:hypothetical protein
MNEFNDIVDTEGLAPEETERLRRVHDMLVEAGPPPDLPPALEHPVDPTETTAQVIDFPLLPPRRWAVAAIAAAALALVALGGGYALGHSHAKPSAFKTQRVVPMDGKGSLAVLRIGGRDKAGNWPMELLVSGLPTQKDPQAYYELWLTKNGKPVVPCGSFRVNPKNTTVRLSVPYTFSHFDGWVVTTQPAHQRSIGPVVLTT